MARYTGPKWRINRRENATVLSGSDKWRRRPTAPGQFPRAKKPVTEYGHQFREKQKVKRMYGMQEKQFRRYFDIALKAEGNTGTRLLQLLELRIDNVIYRLGLAKTRSQARQMVAHGHVLLNSSKHNVPSTILTPGDEIEVKSKILDNQLMQEIKEELKGVQVPAWIEKHAHGGKVVAEPTRDQMDQTIKERLIIELYSK